MTRHDHLGVRASSRSLCLLTEFCHVSFLLPTEVMQKQHISITYLTLGIAYSKNAAPT